MKILLARIDDRLIYGEVTTIWSKGETRCQRIIVCNADVANDEIINQKFASDSKSYLMPLIKGI